MSIDATYAKGVHANSLGSTIWPSFSLDRYMKLGFDKRD
jgi:hypothetical protein